MLRASISESVAKLRDFMCGDLVACAGAGVANHADLSVFLKI